MCLGRHTSSQVMTLKEIVKYVFQMIIIYNHFKKGIFQWFKLIDESVNLMELNWWYWTNDKWNSRICDIFKWPMCIFDAIAARLWKGDGDRAAIWSSTDWFIGSNTIRMTLSKHHGTIFNSFENLNSKNSPKAIDGSAQRILWNQLALVTLRLFWYILFQRSLWNIFSSLRSRWQGV